MEYDPYTDIMNEVYLKQAYVYASQSIDPSTQNGAILIHPSKGIILGSCNGLPKGIEDTPERWERPDKYSYVEHAERNVIYKAAERGIPTQGLYMCCPWYSCCDCARAIIQAGIIKVIGHQDLVDKTPERWKKTTNTGLRMLKQAGIQVGLWPGNVCGGKVQIRFNKEIISP